MQRSTRSGLSLAALAAMIYITSSAAHAQLLAPPTAPGGDADGVETLLRGPLHEAYAEPMESDPTGGLIVPKKPPEPIDEIPPDTKPADEDVIWIPGYWGWDEDRKDFLWVSGVWRVPPPDRRWVPGYWTQADGGYQWIAGFWAPEDVQRVEYLPQPPESLENGPTSAQPSADRYWVSGCWQYRGGRYAWQPGYWGTYHDGWVWLPPHYTWTPRGVIYIGGYWDYPLRRRGQIFAPVYFTRPLYRRAGYYYSPSVAIEVGPLLLHLFIQPRRNHYFWGDFYGDRYRKAGYYAWSNRHDRHGYDPLFSYYQTHYKHRNIDFAKRVNGWNTYYSKHEDRRPAHTYAAQAKLVERAKNDKSLQQSLLGRSTKEILADRDASKRFRHIEEKERRSYSDSRKELRGLSDQRIAIESRKAKAADEKRSDDKRRESVEWKLPQHQRSATTNTTRRPPAKTPDSRRGDDKDDARRDRDRSSGRSDDRARDSDRTRGSENNGQRNPRADRDRSDRDRSDRDRSDRSKDNSKRDDSRANSESRDRSGRDQRPKADAPKRARPERSKPAKKDKKD